MSYDRDHTADKASQSTINDEDLMLSSIDTAELGVDGDTKDQQQEESTEEGLDAQAQAFDPETGEINWDCPCLGGMAHGTCGEEFKAAFSCFVYSKEEPKGMDCIEAFKGMQECFRAHPEEYSDEIDTEDDEYDDDAVKESDRSSDSDNIDSKHTQAAEGSTGV
ncbi:hypothetical protein COEREDRAFT_80644 [Coemansia reversa NRRL 1564]|uniref:Mitochondrial intermembrane space import and assembly protein 40 n=1 Tax=Coemansia reversa (strain ATCC 12441 / NRRL 1564) TaxID=763665 RepID=A0A2G5BF16_COERN|nr:hypothetical protein COEREDRAFT_80644 [Coemansia reversa NRRL 1564]|eukprot:PIA17307.1 hypothetical protein COEREDRAFT_80644 [Coemansia reversa NRRL 1564]